MMNKFYGLDWAVMLINLYSYYLIGNRNKLGFLLGFIGCIAGILLGIFMPSIPLIIMYICFLILNIKGYLQWK